MNKGEFGASPIVIYTSEDNVISLDVKLENETVWLQCCFFGLWSVTEYSTAPMAVNELPTTPLWP